MDIVALASYAEVGGLLFGLHYGYKLLQKHLSQRAQKRWENTEKDVVILHTPGSGKTIPNLSPYSLKLETYMRMAEVKYEIDSQDAYWGPNGMYPWISLNGQHYTDSQLILELLGKKFSKSFRGNYTDEQLATATSIRIMLEEHFAFGGLKHWRFVLGGQEQLQKIMNISPLTLLWFQVFYSRRIESICWYQGIGRHSEDDIELLMKRDLRTVSTTLGSKPYLLGNEPCEDDCAIFGMLAQVMWAMPDSPYELYVNEELPNLGEYCQRMKAKFWDDWDQQLDTVDNEDED